MRNAIFISSGIGNALLLVPLIKHLQKSGPLTAISTSPFKAHEIFEGFEDELFDQVIPLSTTTEWLKHAASFQRKFSVSYLDHFASTRKNIILSAANSKTVVTNTIPHRLPSIFKGNLRFVEPTIGMHESAQYMRFVEGGFTDDDLNEDLFALRAKPSPRISETKYITLQPGSGNNQSPWKTLQLEKWLKLIDQLAQSHPGLNVVVMGDDSEAELSKRLPERPNLVDAIGKTDMSDLPGVISQAEVHIGNDSALMHLAGCLGVPTVSIWGGSDPDHYGWAKVNAKKHQVIYKRLDCAPCSRWIEPNTTKTELPSLCPDFQCLRQITVKEILEAVDEILDRA